MEIYGGDNCLIDYYKKGDSISEIKEKIMTSDEEHFGLAVYITYDNMNEKSIINIVEIFLKCTN